MKQSRSWWSTRTLLLVEVAACWQSLDSDTVLSLEPSGDHCWCSSRNGLLHVRFWHIIFLLIYEPHVAMLGCSSKTLPAFIKGEGRIGVAGTKILHSQYVIDQSAVQALIFRFSFQQNSLFPIKVKHRRMCCSEFCQLFTYIKLMFFSVLQFLMQYLNCSSSYLFHFKHQFKRLCSSCSHCSHKDKIDLCSFPFSIFNWVSSHVLLQITVFWFLLGFGVFTFQPCLFCRLLCLGSFKWSPSTWITPLDPWKTDTKDQASRVKQELCEFDACNCLLVATLRKIWFLWSQGKTVQPQACKKWCLINDSKKLPLCVCFCDCSIRHPKALGGISLDLLLVFL